jgi:hypothetical protein
MFTLELSDAEIQPLSSSKAGQPDGDGSCGAALTTSAMQVTRGQPIKVCFYSAHDNTEFLLTVTLSVNGIWKFVSA